MCNPNDRTHGSCIKALRPHTSDLIHLIVLIPEYSFLCFRPSLGRGTKHLTLYTHAPRSPHPHPVCPPPDMGVAVSIFLRRNRDPPSPMARASQLSALPTAHAITRRLRQDSPTQPISDPTSSESACDLRPPPPPPRRPRLWYCADPHESRCASLGTCRARRRRLGALMS